MTKEEVLAEFAKRGIKVEINGCGCCDSPWVKVLIDDEVVFEEDNVSMDSTQ